MEFGLLTSFLSVIVRLKRTRLNYTKEENIQFFDVKNNFNETVMFRNKCIRNHKKN